MWKNFYRCVFPYGSLIVVFTGQPRKRHRETEREELVPPTGSMQQGEPKKRKREVQESEKVPEAGGHVDSTEAAPEEAAHETKWQDLYQEFCQVPLPQKLWDMDLAGALELALEKKGKKKWRPVDEFLRSCVFNQEDYTLAPVLVATPGDVAAAVGPAVAAAVGPAVAAAVGPVVVAIARLTAMISNLRPSNRNNAAIDAVRSGAVAAGAQPLNPLLKVTPGAGLILPGGPGAGAVPIGHPFAVGVPIPSPPFPATVAALDGLSLAHLDTLAVVYNEDFGIVGGDNAATKRRKFGLWISGL